jgi:DNA-binding CsgD family transcriptional regulator
VPRRDPVSRPTQLCSPTPAFAHGVNNTVSHRATQGQRPCNGLCEVFPSAERITERERESLRLIAGWHTNRAIGEQLHISEKTVETHRTRMMQKLDIHRFADLVRFALSAGLSP